MVALFVVRFKKNKNEFCSFFEKDSNKDRSIFLIMHAESRCKMFYGNAKKDGNRCNTLHYAALHRTAPCSAVR